MDCDADVMTSELFTIDDIIEDKLYDANLNDDEEGEEIIPPSFKDAMDFIQKLRTYLI